MKVVEQIHESTWCEVPTSPEIMKECQLWHLKLSKVGLFLWCCWKMMNELITDMLITWKKCTFHHFKCLWFHKLYLARIWLVNDIHIGIVMLYHMVFTGMVSHFPFILTTLYQLRFQPTTKVNSYHFFFISFPHMVSFWSILSHFSLYQESFLF